MQLKGIGKAIIGLGFGLMASWTAKATLLRPESLFDLDDQGTVQSFTHGGSSAGKQGETGVNLLSTENRDNPASGTGFTIADGATGNGTSGWNPGGMGTGSGGGQSYGGSTPQHPGGSSNKNGTGSNNGGTGSDKNGTGSNNGGTSDKGGNGSHNNNNNNNNGQSSDPTGPVSAVPEAANTSILLGASLLGLSFFNRRYLKRKQ